MDELTIGFKFLTNEDELFTVKSSQAYYYNIPKQDILRIAGKIIKIDGYSNPLIATGYYPQTCPRKSISSDKIHILTMRYRMNLDDYFTKETYKYALKFEKDVKTQYNIQIMSADGSLIGDNNFEDDLMEVPITNNKKESATMNMTMPNMTFGPYNNSRVSISFYGLAVQNATTKRWFSYKGGESYDVTDFLMQGMPNMIFAMPMSIKKIAVGDIILHNNAPMVVQSIIDGKISVVDVSTSEVKEIMPAKSPFGFNFCTKLISMFDGDMLGGDGDDDFFGGNPMMMMAMCGGFNNTDNSGENPMNNMMTMMMMGKMMKNFTD